MDRRQFGSCAATGCSPIESTAGNGCSFLQHGHSSLAIAPLAYEIIDDEEPYYGSVPGLQGVWAGGKTLEECRDRLADVLEGWVLIRLSRGLTIPPLGDAMLVAPLEMNIA